MQKDQRLILAAIFGKKLHILFFGNEGNVYTIWCRMTNISFSQGRPLEMAAILAAIFWKKVDKKLHLTAKILCAKFGYETANGLGEVGEQTHALTLTRFKTGFTFTPNGPFISHRWLCGN